MTPRVDCLRAILSLALLWPSASFADQPVQSAKDEKKTTGEIEEIVVTAKRESSLELQTTISEKELSRGRFSETLEGLLENVAGVDLSRKSFAGSNNNKLRMRGFDESRLAVLLDGRSLSGAGVYGGYYIEWSSLSLEDVESVEIIRGAAPVKYGDTLGGVLNIVTRTGSGEPRTIIRTAGGSLASWDARLSHAWKVGPVRYSLSAGRHETDGYLRNASFKRSTVAGKVAVDLPLDLQLRASARYNANECGMVVYNKPDSPYYDSDKPESLENVMGGPYVPFLNHGPGSWGRLDWGDRSHWDDARTQFDFELSRDTQDFDFTLRAYLMEQDRQELFYAIDDPRHLVLKRETQPEKNNWGWKADLSNVFELLGTHVVEYGAEGRYLGYGDIDISYVDQSYFPPPMVPASSSGKQGVSMYHGVYLQDVWHVEGWLDVELGLRFNSFIADGPEKDAPRLDENGWSPRLAVTVRPWHGGHISARYRRAFRFPSLPEYYWWYSGYQPAERKGLGPEKAHLIELEAGHEINKHLSIVLRAYHYIVDDYIRTIFGYRPSRVVYNIDQVDLTGFELEATYKLPLDIRIWANYTWQLTRKSGDVLDSSTISDELVELPRNKASLGLGYFEEAGLNARLVARYVDLRQTVSGDLTTPGGSYLAKLNPFVTLDVYASYPVLRRHAGAEVRVEISVENLLNQSYMEQYGFPMPGIVFMAGMRATL